MGAKGLSIHKNPIKEYISKGKRITPKFIQELSEKLYDYLIVDSKKYRTSTSCPPLTAAVYCFVNDYTPQCKNCKTDQVLFVSFKIGFKHHCSSKCAGANKETDIKRKVTCVEVYGVDSPQKVKEVRDKFKASMKENHGVEYSGLSNTLNDKKSKTMLKKYGVEHALELKKFRDKATKTTFKKYGVNHAMQNREIMERSHVKGYKVRILKIEDYEFRLRGYEPEAIKYLISLGCKPKNILHTSKQGIPSIVWYDSKKIKHVYHPDLFVLFKGKWVLFEVKSTFTAGLLKNKDSRLSVLKRKAKATKAAGYRFKTLIVSAHKNETSRVVSIIDNIETTLKNDIIQQLKLLHPLKYRQL